ncbi:MAG: glycosyltransferase [Pseudomonadota bacterium]
MKILSITSLYPNEAAPNHGVFVENRLVALKEQFDVDLTVIAPVPWFPSAHPLFGKYARFAAVPQIEVRRGITIYHPRYAIPPKIGMTYAPFAMERATARLIHDLTSTGLTFDLIDGHYLYPDGVAAARIAADFTKPLFLTARGSDVTEIAAFPRQRNMILSSAAQASGVICVARALSDQLHGMGVPDEKLHVLRNGVDLDLFRPKTKATTAVRSTPPPYRILSVGHLIERKGHDLIISTLKELSAKGIDASLTIVGDGPQRSALESHAKTLGVSDQVEFKGSIPHGDLAFEYSSADVLALGSTREGWPNVLLEAMACGTPVVATPVGGCAEVITQPAAGRVAVERSVNAMTDAIVDLFQNPPGREETRRYAERFSWAHTSERLYGLFTEEIDRNELASKALHSASMPRPYEPTHPAIARSSQGKGKAKPKLLITVDTEEIFDWNDFSGQRIHVPDPCDVDRFHDVCKRAGGVPLYLLTYPMLKDAPSTAYFQSLDQKGEARLGLHLHHWTTPPITEHTSEFYSWQMNLPSSVHRQKLNVLADTFEAVFGKRATAHRAGRYGIAPHCYPALAEAGVHFDFSPSPAFDFSRNGGPNFQAMSNHPFLLEVDRGADRASHPILVTPASGAFGRRGTSFFTGAIGEPGFGFSTKQQPPLFSSPMRLSPEGTSLEDMVGLAKHLTKAGVEVLTFSIHSSTLTTGANQYVQSSRDVDALLERTASFLDVFQNEIGGALISFDEFQSAFPVVRQPPSFAHEKSPQNQRAVVSA